MMPSLAHLSREFCRESCWRYLCGFVGMLVVAAWFSPALADSQALQLAIQKAQAAAHYVGLYAVEEGSGQVLLELNSRIPLNVASNAKLLTAAAALEKHGPNHRFETLVWGEVAAGIVPKGLVVQGSGDPGLRKTHLAELARAVRRKGVVAVSGGIAFDDAHTGGELLPPGFDAKDDPSAFRTAVGALSFDSNAAVVAFQPGALGERPAIRVRPAGEWCEVDNRATTEPGNAERLQIATESRAGKTVYVVTGSIGAEHKGGSVKRRVDNPSTLFAYALREQLAANRVHVEGNAPHRAAAPSSHTTPLVRYQGPPLRDTLRRVNQDSDNAAAELLFLSLGEPGRADWDGARRFALQTLSKAASASDVGEGAVVNNGSGLYDGMRLSPAQLVALLRWVRKQPYADDFEASLALTGRSGTLKSRLKKTSLDARVWAKTGTLDHVSALSGWLSDRRGRIIVFSFLFVDFKDTAAVARAAQDALLLALSD